MSDAEEIIQLADKRNEFVIDVDGYVYYQPFDPAGYFSAAVLRVLADELDRRNALVETILKAAIDETPCS